MATINTESITTAEQLLELPDDFGLCELVRGELIMMNAAGWPHGRVERKILVKMANFVEEHRLGEVSTSDTGFILERNPDTVRSPDVGFVRASRIPSEPIQGFFPGPPDLAVEIHSPSDRPGEIRSKIKQYLETGVVVVWEVDPEARTVTVHRRDGSVEKHSGEAVLTEPGLLPGFSMAIEDIFD
jgi:Uma2 family endonuclease